ncbi:MAG TPA: CHAT domain-containing tetratricopeptide repeat protein [Thermoanaerobaculia bacterium]|jgi:CHAT domain-containing protein/Tfp pilus assembly protein PilF|nr:CHAT domain-containing tetratricopeptide repeat protein [Thermoanaerobaculia bacterium]
MAAPYGAVARRGVPFLALALAAFVGGAAPGAEEATLAPGVPIERDLAGGERHAYRIEPAAGPLLVSVEQRGINVALTAVAPGNAKGADGADLGLSNQDGQREGWETLLLPARGPDSGAWRVEVIGRETEVPPGRYEIRLDELPDATPEERRRVEAEGLLSEIGRLRPNGDGDSMRRIVALAEQALPGFAGAGRELEAARTLFLQAEADRALSDCRSAVPLHERAVALFAATGAEAAESQAQTALGLCRLALGELDEALAQFDRALAIERRRGDCYGEATTRANVCLVRHVRGEWRESIPCYEQAIALLVAVRASDTEWAVRSNLGGVYDLLGEPGKARAAYEAALPVLRAIGEKRSEMPVLNNLGVVLAGLGETSEALALYDQALAAALSLGDRSWEARTRQNRGVAYLAAGEAGRAIAEIEQALVLRRAVGDRPGEITALGLLGTARDRLGEREAALDLETRAATLAREAHLRGPEATARQLLARTYLAAGQALPALQAAEQAVELFAALEDRRGLATALSRKGEALRLAGKPEAALAPLGEALALRRGFDDRAGQAETLTALATAERQLDRKDAARTHVEEALDLVETLRAAVVAPELRASFLAAKQQTFELALQLRMEQAATDPKAAEAGFALAERARARTLLDLLDAARADAAGAIDPLLRQRAAEIGQRLAAKAQRRIEILAGRAPDAHPELAREIEDLLSEDDRVAAEIRRSAPRTAALALPEPLGAADVRRLLAPDELLLEVSLGEERSFLWAVTQDEMASFVLPPRADIERLARRVYEDLRTADAGDAQGAEAERAARHELSRMLLGPVAHRLGERRLIVIADGALQYVPLAALPPPDDPADVPLIEGHEIISLPSASVLAALRTSLRAPEVKREPGGNLKVPPAAVLVGDPVFSRLDPRVHAAISSASGASAASSAGEMDEARGGTFQRLPNSRREVEEIAPLVSRLPGGAITWLDFDASRAAVLGGSLGEARLVHFATHGVIDAETPRLSGLVLSLVDQYGAPQEGFLGLADLYGLSLHADLVVLSGCETALGREMRGEGLVGLTRGFLQAGARRVLASLWRVQDRPTAELMVRFYRAHLEAGLSPAAALREAQRSIRRERRWQDPAYWAGFVLEGDGAAQ